MNYEINKGTATVGGEKFSVYKREVRGANAYEVVVGTNGYKGGDSGYGSRTIIQLKDVCGSDIRCKVLESKDSNGGFEIIVGGDSELLTLIDALDFMSRVLKAQSKGADI